MITTLTKILMFSLIAFGIAFAGYPVYIRFLQTLKVRKTIRDKAITGEDSRIFSALHAHKAGTPTMGGGLFLFVMILMIGLSLIAQNMEGIIEWLGFSPWTKMYDISYNLINRRETYVILFSFFSMGFLGLIDDYLNVKSIGKTKGLSARAKMVGMTLFSAFIAYWFWLPLDHTSMNFWPLAGMVDLGWFFPLLLFVLTIAMTNAINFTDGLDGLAGGLIVIILAVLAVMTFYFQWYIATTVIGIVIGVLIAFLWFNINPAKVFMGDSGAFALGGLIASVVYLLNLKTGIIVPFMILFGIVWRELISVTLQIFRKKVFKKKLFPIAPYHHTLEHQGMAEHTIVMKMWLLQAILASVALIMFFYQTQI